MKNPFDFSGRTVLVTGSSRGIGAAIVKGFGEVGARCAVNYVADPEGRNQAEAEAVAATLKDPLIIQCDVGDPKQVAEMMVSGERELGGLDILINNAGILKDRTLKK